MRRSLTLEYWRDQESFVGRLLEVPVPEFEHAWRLRAIYNGVSDNFLVVHERLVTQQLL